MSTSTRDRLYRLERAMLRVRWFGLALGAYQVFGYVPNPGTEVPRWTTLIAGIALALLLATNLVVQLALRRRPDAVTMARLGRGVFAADVAAVWTIVWAYNFEPYGTTWVLVPILALEGALRFQLRGAMAPAIMAVPIETVREVVRLTSSFAGQPEVDFWFGFSAVTFRIGIIGMIGAVAGVMARNLEREREAAELRARESSAFQQVILAGVSAEGLHDVLRSMIDTIATALGYERLAVLMRNDDGSLEVVTLRGFAGVEPGLRVPAGTGIAGVVVATGETEVVPDVRADDRYNPVSPATRSQITLPIRAGDDTIGVLDVESDRLDAFGDEDRARLERLCAQMGLVIDNARLLAAERATVERLRELDVMKSDFVAIASHELRTPLTAMQGSIKTIRRGSFSPQEMDELLAIVDRQSDRLTRLVEDLLIASRIDSGRVQLRMDAVDLGELLTDVLSELGPRAERVSLAVAPTLPRLVTDGGRVAQIVRNLVENALKFSPDEAPVRISAHHSRDGLVIQVSDDGPGIPAEEVPHIFERFHQIGGSLRRRGEGIGLGLYITKRLTEALGGRIEVDSIPGRGTTFNVYVPVAAADAGSSEIA